VPQDALLEMGEAGVRHEAEDLLVHGDNLEGVVREYRQSRPRGEKMGNEIKAPAAPRLNTHLIIPEESSVQSRAAIFRKEVCEALEDIPALERLEQAQDDVEVARPATAHARDRLDAHAGGLPVLGPLRVLGAEADGDGDAEQCEGQIDGEERERSAAAAAADEAEEERGHERRHDERLGEGEEDALAVVRDGLLKGGEWAAGCHEFEAGCVCERKRERRGEDDASSRGETIMRPRGNVKVRTEGPKGEEGDSGRCVLVEIEGGGVRVKKKRYEEKKRVRGGEGEG
jgi:hypothetical protein